VDERKQGRRCLLNGAGYGAREMLAKALGGP
jgi:hypothetical protein